MEKFNLYYMTKLTNECLQEVTMLFENIDKLKYDILSVVNENSVATLKREIKRQEEILNRYYIERIEK